MKSSVLSVQLVTSSVGASASAGAAQAADRGCSRSRTAVEASAVIAGIASSSSDLPSADEFQLDFRMSHRRIQRGLPRPRGGTRPIRVEQFENPALASVVADLSDPLQADRALGRSGPISIGGITTFDDEGLARPHLCRSERGNASARASACASRARAIARSGLRAIEQRDCWRERRSRDRIADRNVRRLRADDDLGFWHEASSRRLIGKACRFDFVLQGGWFTQRRARPNQQLLQERQWRTDRIGATATTIRVTSPAFVKNPASTDCACPGRRGRPPSRPPGP